MKPFFLYMLRCADGKLYVGHTDDLEKRIALHKSGALGGWTKRRRPVELVFADGFATRAEALEREMQVKGWTRAKKEALIARDWKRIHSLARGPDRTSVRPSTTRGPDEPAVPAAALRSGRTDSDPGSGRTDRRRAS
jgi:predicted GIY-YIG superfamily endonuclease